MTMEHFIDHVVTQKRLERNKNHIRGGSLTLLCITSSISQIKDFSRSNPRRAC